MLYDTIHAVNPSTGRKGDTLVPLTHSQLDAYHRDGYVLVPGLFDAAQMQAALADMERIFYGRSFAEYLAGCEQAPTTTRDGFHSPTDQARSQFPCGSEALDRLIENEEYLDVFSQCLGSDRVNYCNAHLFMRSGPTDQRHSPEAWQGYHVDHDTNSFLPPGEQPGLYDYVNSGVYLHDVEDDGAPMHVIPGSHLQLAQLMPRLIREGQWQGRSGIKDIRQAVELATPVPATAPAGSALFYSSYLVHAPVPFRNKRKQRALWTLSMARADTCPWVRFANPWNFGERDFTIPFWTRTSPRVRTLFGWPPPGHPYYTSQTLDLLGTWFPGMDLGPYRSPASGPPRE